MACGAAGLDLLHGLPITKLRLSGYKLGQNYHLDLRSLVGLPIADLHLIFIRTTNASIEILEALPLTKLCLQHCDRFTDFKLARLQRLPMLSSLTVIDCADLSKAGVASLEEGAAPLEVPTKFVSRFVYLVRNSLSELCHSGSELLLKHTRVISRLSILISVLSALYHIFRAMRGE